MDEEIQEIESEEEVESEEVSDDEAAKAALESTEEKEKVEYAPMSVVDELREDRRQLRQQVTELTQRLDEQPKGQDEEKSPMEKFADEYGNVPPDAQTIVEQQKWERTQADNRAKKKAADDNQAKMVQYEQEAKETYSTEKAGAGLDLTSILRMGEGLLTEGDKVDIVNETSNGRNPLILAYKRCISRINEAGGDNAKKLADRIKIHKELTEKKSKEDEEKDVKEKKKGGKPPENPEEEYDGERIHKPLVDFIFSDNG